MTEATGMRVARLVGEIIARDVDPGQDASASLRELGVSSLRMIELIGALESSFDFRIADEDIDESNFGTLGALVAFVTRRSPEGTPR